MKDNKFTAEETDAMQRARRLVLRLRGERIYPSWQGALEGKRLVMRDVRLMNGRFLLHDPYRNVVERGFDDLKAVEAYILENGKLITEGANVWD